ncbi:hypothetical protein FRC12_016257, partial [Ceratobasidium sp. 428]
MKQITSEGLQPRGYTPTDASLPEDGDVDTSFADHQREDVTHRLDLNECSSQPCSTGNMSNIYRGRLTDGVDVAIKCVKDMKYSVNALREIVAWSKSRHENVLQLIGSAEYMDLVAMVSPWMANGCLSTYLFTHPEVEGYAV